MSEIICVSCWKGFEVEEPPPPSVNCPHCDFAQPGRVVDTTGVGVQAMPDEPAAPADAAPPAPADAAPPAPADAAPAPEEAAPEADPFESMEAEITSELDGGGDSEDNRWRIQTTTGLLLFFPQAELACQWADGQDDGDLQIAFG
ncbi:MAG: hypothetical protein VX938_12975, partial [Myxococcota bacterium]|nr:hypothetical protein [Myxococcota bacterium]